MWHVTLGDLVDWQSGVLVSQAFLPFCSDFTDTCSLLISYLWVLQTEHLHRLQWVFWELGYA